MKQLPDIKVCGMRDPANIASLCELDLQYLGFIFVESSKRYVGYDPDPEIFRIAAGRAERVGVFVDAPQERVLEQLEKDHIDLVQLHGSESLSYCQELRDRGVRLIKMLSPEPGVTLDAWADVVDFLLLDSAGKGQGGSGAKFDWQLLDQMEFPLPYFLSGGIGPTDVPDLKVLEHKRLHALDLNSKFEKAPGLKDVDTLKEFIKEIRDK